MEKEAISTLINSSYSNYIAFIKETDDDFWLYAPEGKWTVGQHTLHLLDSTKPLNFALSLPNFIIKWKFGTSNRAVRSYEDVIKRYEERLAQNRGNVYKGSQNMGIPEVDKKAYLLNRLQTEHRKLSYKTSHYSDKSLDHLILPHPLMGRMPLREIIMWSAHHVDHHLSSVKDYQKSP